MRIAIDFSTLDHLQMTAGHYRYVVQLVRGLAEIGGAQEFLLFGSRNEPVAELKEVFGSGSRWSYRRIVHWRHRGTAFVDEMAYLRHFLFEQISLLHIVHDFIPRCARCPVIVTKHDLIEEIFPEYEAKRRHVLYRIHRRRVESRADRIICISQTTANDLERFWGIGGERNVVIHHGVEEDFFSEPGDDLLQKHPVFSPGNVILASPYNLEPRKNLPVLAEALSALRRDFPRLKLVLFGRALLNPEREKEFEVLIESLGLQDSVVRLGIVSDAMLRQIYRRADVFVFPSLYEGLGSRFSKRWRVARVSWAELLRPRPRWREMQRSLSIPPMPRSWPRPSPGCCAIRSGSRNCERLVRCARGNFRSKQWSVERGRPILMS